MQIQKSLYTFDIFEIHTLHPSHGCDRHPPTRALPM
jgi:hypothetical protein